MPVLATMSAMVWPLSRRCARAANILRVHLTEKQRTDIIDKGVQAGLFTCDCDDCDICGLG